MSEETIQERLGLGLSGGGLRASFFHIGILAQMAELNLLKNVEVISTVSGGSIIGALYYLHVKKLLESKEDKDITDRDYVEIVHTIEKDFLEATEKNIRMETFSSFAANFKMIFLNYSRSDRIAEIYNDWLYQKVLPGVSNPIQMRELKIFPKGGEENFHPNKHNGNRSAKVPILVLNATSLNTGRNWQFTAQTMGEPFIPKESEIDETSTCAHDNSTPHKPLCLNDNDIDCKPIRLSAADGYNDFVKAQQDFPLAHAVAASACVPGLFDPMSVSGLYKDLEQKQDIRVQLVDGGVHDNQGINVLLRNKCTCFVISDASGQMNTEDSPETGSVPVLLRTSTILQDRVRTEGLLLLKNSQGTHNVAFMNLRAGLEVREIFPINQHDNQPEDKIFPATSPEFGVNPEVQEGLSKIRTDLDAFTEVEAYSLMLDAYRMSKQDLEHFKEHAHCMQAAKPASERTPPPAPWRFTGIEPWINNPNDDYKQQLKIAQLTFGKALMRFSWLWIALPLLAIAAIYFLGPHLVAWLKSSIPVYVLVGAAVIWLISAMAPKLAHVFGFLNVLRPQAEVAKEVFRAAGLLLGTVFIKFYQLFINQLYVNQGRLDKLTKP
ncbi:MAG: patatin-like phospholipase family protein [Methylobacter sp.]